MFFQDLFTHFLDFWSQIGRNRNVVVILVTPKQEVERKSEWYCGVKFFRSIFKVEWEKGIWTKIRVLAYCFLFTCGNFTLIFTVFFNFLDWILFMIFTIHSLSVLGLIFCSVNEILWIVRQDLSCCVFFISSSLFMTRWSTITSNLPFVHSFVQFQLNCVRGVIFYT